VRGQLIRGVCGYAGELEFLPFEHLGVPVTFCEKLRRIKADMADPTAEPCFFSVLPEQSSASSVSLTLRIVALSGFGLAGSDIADLQGNWSGSFPPRACSRPAYRGSGG